MKTRDIVIIIILTIIIIIALTTTLQKNPEIENIYLSYNKDSDFDELQHDDNSNFKSKDPDIYLIIKVKNLSADDEIKVEWGKTVNDTYSIIQKNIIIPDGNGSGRIVILFVRRNNIYAAGDYNVKVYLNGEDRISKKFFISDQDKI